jgi:hypothetical protein
MQCDRSANFTSYAFISRCRIMRPRRTRNDIQNQQLNGNYGSGTNQATGSGRLCSLDCGFRNFASDNKYQLPFRKELWGEWIKNVRKAVEAAKTSLQKSNFFSFRLGRRQRTAPFQNELLLAPIIDQNALTRPHSSIAPIIVVRSSSDDDCYLRTPAGWRFPLREFAFSLG